MGGEEEGENCVGVRGEGGAEKVWGVFGKAARSESKRGCETGCRRWTGVARMSVVIGREPSSSGRERM